MTENTHYPAQISPLLIHLLKGVLYQENQPEAWRDLLTFQAAVRDYFAILFSPLIPDFRTLSQNFQVLLIRHSLGPYV